MQKTVGIYDHEKQWHVFEILAQRNIKFALCYYIAIETGLRIGDILSLQRPIGSKLRIIEQKTGKTRTIELSDDLNTMLAQYEELVPRIAGVNLMFNFSRTTFWRQMKMATEEIGLSGIGVHGLRKTYG